MQKNILPLLPWCFCLHFAIFPYLMSLLLFFQFFFISVRSDCCHHSSCECLFLGVFSLTSSVHLCRLLPITTPRAYYRPRTCASSLTCFLYCASFHDPPPTIWLFLLSSLGSELNRGNFCGCWTFISYCLRCPFRYLSLHPFSVSPAYYQLCNYVISSVLNCPFSDMSLRTPLWSSAHYHLRKLAVCFLFVLSVIRTNVLWHWSPAHYQVC